MSSVSASLIADQRVHVAVGHVMNHLTHRPALGPVRRIQLCVAQVGHRLAEARREAFDRVDGRAAQLVGDRHDRLECPMG